MCLISVRRKDSEKFHDKYFTLANERNADGIGIMYVKEGRVVAKKLEGRAAAYQKRALYTEFANAPAPSCLHVRIGTAGNKSDEFNAHPFQILDKEQDGVDLWMMHNGHFNNADKIDSTKSDSWHFANLYIKKLVKKNPYILCDPYIQQMIKLFTAGSRVVFLYSCGTRIILDDGAGHEDEKSGGSWLSNRSGASDACNTTTNYSNYHSRNNNYSRVKDEFDEYEDEYYYGFAHKTKHNKDYTDYTPNKNKNTILTQVKKEPIMIASNVVDIKVTQEEVEVAKADTTPSLFTLPEDFDEAIEALAGMNDDAVKDFVEGNQEDAITLLINFRDYYQYHGTKALIKTA